MTNVSNFFGVGNDETVAAKWQDRVQHMHATSRLVGRGYKPSNAGETPESAVMLSAVPVSAVPGTAPVFNQQLSTPYVRDPLRR